MVKTAVLVSGGGANLQAILDARLFGELKNCDLCAVISSNPDVYALERAERAGIPTHVVDINIFPNRASFTEAISRKLKDMDIELVVLAGFNYILSSPMIRDFKNRIINVHPSLLPAFCGGGCYGVHVHEAALAYGAKVSGATAHFVTNEIDHGPIILQRAVEIFEDDTPMTLQQRVMEQAEWQILPEAISLFCSGRLKIEDNIVHILPEETL